ncbi:MAG: hypothetical protein JNM22_05650 [Saprospiraceae bacterium]|nr:hypothetical protein [Saprospiraceae bacterium]
MSDVKDKVPSMEDIMKRLEAAEQKANVAEAKVAALEAVAGQTEIDLAESAPVGGKPTLTGETFIVDKSEYKVVVPVINHNGKDITEADILADKDLQKELVKGRFGVIRKVAAWLLFLFAFSTAQATSVTINANSAEVISTTKREFYALQDMRIIYRASNDAFEIQTAETISKVWGGDIDSVTISGASTASQKLAFLRTLMLEATTTSGYRVFIGRNSVEFNYTSATNRLDIKHGRNKQPLWFGSIDSLQVGALSGSTAKLAWIREVNKWRDRLCLPNAVSATIAAGAAAGSSPTVSVSGDAYSGVISITTGTSATTGTLATVTLKITAPTGTRIVVSGLSGISKTHDSRWTYSTTTTTLVLTNQTTAFSDATLYTFTYYTEPY